MAGLLKLYLDSTEKVDLMSAADSGWRVVNWHPASGNPDTEALVEENLLLQCERGTHDNLATSFQALDEMRILAGRHIRDRAAWEPVWLHAQMAAETGVRRSLVHSIGHLEWMTDQVRAGGFPDGEALRARVKILREWWWEPNSSRSITSHNLRHMMVDSVSVRPTVGETITGATSGHTADVVGFTLVSGSLAGGTGAGRLYLKDANTFQDNENLNGTSSGSNFATVDGTRGFGPAGMFDYTLATDISGDMPSRLRYMSFAPGGAYELGRLWIGIRSEQKVTNPERFALFWELEDGTQIDADCAAAITGGNTASPHNGTGNDHIWIDDDRGGGSATDWDDGDFHKAWKVQISQVAGVEPSVGPDAEELLGTHLLLMRAYVTAGTWEVQLRAGHALNTTDAEFLQLWKVEIASTSWDIFEMGYLTLPLINNRALADTFIDLDDEIASVDVQLWARRTSGSGDLYMDCIIPIPVDEGYLIVKDCFADATVEEIWFGQGPLPRDRLVGQVKTDTPASQTIQMPRSWNFALPPGDGRMMICWARSSTSVLGNQLTPSVGNHGTFFERWINLRGSE
jgi:hypothetical protein